MNNPDDTVWSRTACGAGTFFQLADPCRASLGNEMQRRAEFHCRDHRP